MEAAECGGHAGDTHFDHKLTDIAPSNKQFTIDDLLDLPKDDDLMTDAVFDDLTGTSADSSTITVFDTCNSSASANVCGRNFVDHQFSCGELCVPYDDLAELEWLSNFVEDSFSSDDLHTLQLISATKAPTDTASSDTSATIVTAASRHDHHYISSITSCTMFPSDVSVPGKARSKRSRAAPCDWSSRLLVVSPTNSSSDPSAAAANRKAPRGTPSKKRETAETVGRKCLHCGSEKTPQWRTGPGGPKTLCNACGVRYKSGRLVPEYRPAASPTFVPTKHSNSHRKVIELRRQKELQRATQQQQPQPFLTQSSIFGVSSNGGDEYLMLQHCGPDFGHMIL